MNKKTMTIVKIIIPPILGVGKVCIFLAPSGRSMTFTLLSNSMKYGVINTVTTSAANDIIMYCI